MVNYKTNVGVELPFGRNVSFYLLGVFVVTKKKLTQLRCIVFIGITSVLVRLECLYVIEIYESQTCSFLYFYSL